MSEKRKIDSNTPVTVMSNAVDRVIFKNTQTQAEYVWEDYGTFYELFYSDLMNMRNSAKGLIMNGYLFILDEDVVEQLRLKKLYENMIKPEDIDEFFKQTPKKMKEQIKKMPKGMKELLLAKAQEKLRNNDRVMDSTSRRKVFEDEFGFKLDEYDEIA